MLKKKLQEGRANYARVSNFRNFQKELTLDNLLSTFWGQALLGIPQILVGLSDSLGK